MTKSKDKKEVITIQGSTIEMVIDWALLDESYIDKFLRMLKDDMAKKGCREIDVQGLQVFCGDEGLAELKEELHEMLFQRRIG